ncbi:MAG: DUF1016 N-terminal domain-containing protein [Hydrogenophaga sp.]|uniref:DUF1016 N-terminal domain-containing protein n=1 Tax=Hydrogenophaga sp. TaxID=1904254 RepID=UPI002727B1A5|nr:DUF1016 N-terminal domain-containing protein [Hydrogenophaga sp.]MDO9147069.1 DUF1016 N-terminal domain-containing protein [Hydrogenophaga sp.]MDO9605983.1 DUF1016 N-terminal domain-containing protein [Hydrogenophaga sp.]MDP2163209.1 DUF1016 N-terminal domain-containing protein [Hydrogenophaga sp.]MDP3476306.1 DUF1016 N-terminal domain-containing protein [Hydrogenophaga sp.]
MPTPATTAPTAATPLLAEVRQLIDAARQRVASAVNAELTQLYWHIGRRISAELLQGQRGTYGQQVVAELARQLTADFGKGWSERQLHYCVRVAEVFPDAGILHTLCSQLSWSHLRLVIQIEDPLKRDFYLEICRVERWSVRQLQERINALLYERTAISKKPRATSGWPPPSLCSRRVKPCRPSCTSPSNWPGKSCSATPIQRSEFSNFRDT